MKRYMYIMLLALLAQYGLSDVMYAMEIVPSTTGDDAIVNAIKRYSDLTKADTEQYKLLWLRSLGTTSAFLAGAVSTIGTGIGAYQTTRVAQDIIAPARIPNWTANLVLAGLGSMSAGYISYKLLYPRIKEGILNKVGRLEKIYQGLQSSSIVQNGYNIDQLKSKLPVGWGDNGDIAVYNALVNLVEQGQYANALLGQIYPYGYENDINNKMQAISKMVNILKANKDIYEKQSPEIQKRKQEEAEEKENQKKAEKKQQKAEKNQLKEKEKNVQIAETQASANLKQQGANALQAQTIATYGEMFANGIKSVRDTLNWLYKNKEKLVYRAGILATAAYGIYSGIKAKSGWGQ